MSKSKSKNSFEENYCRLCREVLCCVKCRCAHETRIHNVNPNCEICLYGRVDLKNLPYHLLDHIQVHHWPLHCLKCKRRFESIDHLTMHTKCPAGSVPNSSLSKKSAGIIMSAEIRYDSPPLSDFHKNLPNPNIAASTPTPKIELDREPTIITPVNDTEKEQHSTEGLTPTDSAKNDLLLKRRVTFCETPILEYSDRKQLLNVHKSASIAEEDAPDKLRSKLRIASVHQNPNNIHKTLPEKTLEISVSPLINNDAVDCDSPEGTDSHKSIIAGSNKFFFCKSKDMEAVTSTPRVGKQDDQKNANTKVEIPTERETKLSTNIVQTPKNVTSETPDVKIDTMSNIRKKGAIEKCPASYQTPIMSATMKQKQLLATTRQFTGETTSQFYTPSLDITHIPLKITEEDENLQNELVDNNYIKTNIQIEETLWMSAVNNMNCSEDEDDIQKTDSSIKGKKQKPEILSVCLKKVTHVPQNVIAISTETNTEVPSKIDVPKANLWTSMTQAFNSVVTGLSMLNKSGFVGEQVPSSIKRTWVDDDEEDESGPDMKRLKITDVKCRRTIRPICPLSHSVFKIMVDKATQTD